jgi:predicted outer membrane repeat protein
MHLKTVSSVFGLLSASVLAACGPQSGDEQELSGRDDELTLAPRIEVSKVSTVTATVDEAGAGPRILSTGLVAKIPPNVPDLMLPIPTLTGSAVVGNGTPQSCTETALNSAVAMAASITFNCGGPAKIIITTPKTVAATQTIDGGGTVTLDGNLQSRLFVVTSTGTLNLSRITLAQGFSQTADGAAIANHGLLNLNDVTVRNNVAIERQGAIFTDGRNVKIENSRFTSNSAESGGAIAMGPAAATPGIQISNTQFNGNLANGPTLGAGGAILANAGCLVVKDSFFNGNRAIQGGALVTLPGVVLTILGSTPNGAQFNNNSALTDGGAIITVQSNTSIGNTVFSQNLASPDTAAVGFGGAVVNLGGPMTISNGLFFQNSGRFGGAIHSRPTDAATANLTVDRTTFLSNKSGVFGGAIYLRGVAASTVITNSSFESNTAVDAGGGLVRNDGALRIESSSFTGNSAARGGGLMVSTLPGSPMNPYVRIQNVTVANNSANTSDGTFNGGGLFNTGAGVEMYSMTIAGNVSGGVVTDAANSRFRDTVLQNAGANCSLRSGSQSDDGANFATDATCNLVNTSSRQGTMLNPGLGALTRDPNGLTSFMKPGRLSPLLDRGLSCPALDQMGAARIGACDIGAVESGTALVVNVGGGGVFTMR